MACRRWFKCVPGKLMSFPLQERNGKKHFFLPEGESTLHNAFLFPTTRPDPSFFHWQIKLN